MKRKRKIGSTTSMERSAGILIHITSLPGPYGIGDIGPESRKFADFLQQAGQRYWQLLPTTPIEEAKGNSPYSSSSSFAGNTMLISMDDLVRDGLIDRKETLKYRLTPNERVDFEHARAIKNDLLSRAFIRFKRGKNKKSQKAFQQFIAAQRYWLEDFACYSILKKHYEGKPWSAWPNDFKERRPASLKAFTEQRHDELQQVKWEQFVFFQQWQELKKYCNSKTIHLFGDLPIYVDYDSSDVWAYRDNFHLDKNGERVLVAGVPPDYFNESGQLWGMPVYRWAKLRRKNFIWWISRIRKNLELFDLIRLDHFRAFAAYWAVSASETTARNGKWIKGPGRDFFTALQDSFSELPFVAEDLGDIDQDVIALRQQFALPGMKVLHFAFGENMSTSDYIPHNYSSNFIVYTGTHDNNTSRGWYTTDISDTEKKNLKNYSGQRVTQQNVHTVLMRLAYASVARLAVIPMQDILGLGKRSRMNSPATINGNWEWRMLPGAATRDLALRLKAQAALFSR